MVETGQVWGHWRGHWIWDHEPEAALWWRPTPPRPHAAFIRRRFELSTVPDFVPARATCDSRYALYLNGELIGRGPVREEPEHLSWDEYDLAGHLCEGTNVLVAVCRYYGQPSAWWLPASALGTLGRGSFCFETMPGPVDLVTDEQWSARPAPWLRLGTGGMHWLPPEVVDGRLVPADLHAPDADDNGWSPAVLVAGVGHGTVLDRPPAAPYMSPLRRSIPQLTSRSIDPELRHETTVSVDLTEDPVSTWWALLTPPEGRARPQRHVSVWDVGGVSLGHVHLSVETDGDQAGAAVDVVGGEDLRADGLPEIEPREWAGRYVLGEAPSQHITFFDPVGLRFLAVHHPPGVKVRPVFEETLYPSASGAEFDCSDERYTERWHVGRRTVDVCSTDAFLDCPGREQRAWVSDAYPQILVSLVTSPDHRLVRRQLALTSRSRFPSGLLAGAAACDFARIGFTMPEYSLHWIRTLAAYWRYTGDAEFVESLLPVADGIIERHEQQVGPSGLLEEVGGWVFLDWAQVDRDVVTGAHDALYAAALEDYALLPGASVVDALRARTAEAFEALWDEERRVYVDAIGPQGPSRRISQHTNGAALMAGLVPPDRVEDVIERVMAPSESPLAGRLVVTPTPADLRDARVAFFQYLEPDDFDPEHDVVAAQPWFCRFLHEGLFRHGRRDLVLENLLRWQLIPGNGTFQEFWSAAPGTSSRCHGWASSPTFDLTSYVLGVRPEGPGYASAVVDPFLGPLAWAEGRVPTPHGWLSVRVDGEAIELESPAGSRIRVGDQVIDEPGRHRVEHEESR